MAAEWWWGIGVGLFYTVLIAITGAGLRPSAHQEVFLGAMYRVLGGGIFTGFVVFSVVRWVLPVTVGRLF